MLFSTRIERYWMELIKNDFYLTDVSVRHVVDPESLVADSFLWIFLWIDVDVALGRVQHVRHVDAQQIGEVLHGLAGAWKKYISWNLSQIFKWADKISIYFSRLQSKVLYSSISQCSPSHLQDYSTWNSTRLEHSVYFYACLDPNENRCIQWGFKPTTSLSRVSLSSNTTAARLYFMDFILKLNSVITVCWMVKWLKQKTPVQEIVGSNPATADTFLQITFICNKTS